ncbi:peptide chain release factor H [Actinoplanes subtropicus]|uniref:peptide chain release factor H n=1 Tax=Actinoplanes subtropicus TaxID=543632 RepID=UPI0004C39787|nr:peptide chain release factor H [Actinoplanes subtropicus]
MTTHLLLSAGRGPAECSWAVARLVGRLEKDAARHGVAVARVDAVDGERAGTFRSVLLRIGDDAFAAAWTGTLCWQAPSPYRRGHGRKNWYVTARPCSLDAPATPFAESDVEVVAVRTGGPGGQHRNKASTAARATHRPSGLVVVADTERQFSLNRSLALRRLRELLAAGDAASARALADARWQIHDDLVRGDPVRTFTSRPGSPT